MWNPKLLPRHLHLAVALALPLGTVAVLACGPDFAVQVLDDRSATLKSTPANTFAFEATHLVTATDALRAQESPSSPAVPSTPATPASQTPDDARIKSMTSQADGDAAYAVGTDVAPALRLYTAAAIDFRNSASDAARTRAATRFQAVLELPHNEAAPRAVWAAYMLGQLHGAAMTAAGHPLEVERSLAIQAYTTARAQAIAGAADPQGLAVASLGEQARLYLIGQAQQCSYVDFMQATPCADTIAAADLRQAIRLYAEQAARKSNSAIDSLGLIAQWALGDAGRVGRLIGDPLAQRLLVSYALARVGDIVDGDRDSASDYYASGKPGYADAATGNPHIKLNPPLQVLATALQQQGVGQIAGLDRAAALAYRSGHYALAQTLAGHQRSALSSWVLAKLALRRGDNAAAAQAYADAVQAFPRVDGSLDPLAQAQIQAEQGVLTLSRGEYVAAFEQLYSASAASQGEGRESPVFGDYTGDSIYLAERVLSTNELKRYVDLHLPATPMPPAPTAINDRDMNAYWRWRAQHPAQLSDHFRQILARRLMRDGRIAEALPYFPDDQDWRYRRVVYAADDGQPSLSPLRLRSTAKAYGVALYTAQHAWRDNSRAQAWYRAAQLVRESGMEIMGTEQAPDFAAFDGAYSTGVGRSQTDATARTTTAPQRAAADLSGPYTTDGERQRYAASEAHPYDRFHYRAIASSHIMQAADALPPRSQAFAAVLCQGAAFVIYQPEQVAPLYRRYLKQGAAVPFAAHFGRDCPAPDFAAAASFPYRRLWQQRILIGCALLLFLLAGSGVLIARRRAKSR